jgi:hypothetical protein
MPGYSGGLDLTPLMKGLSASTASMGTKKKAASSSTSSGSEDSHDWNIGQSHEYHDGLREITGMKKALLTKYGNNMAYVQTLPEWKQISNIQEMYTSPDRINSLNREFESRKEYQTKVMKDGKSEEVDLWAFKNKGQLTTVGRAVEHQYRSRDYWNNYDYAQNLTSFEESVGKLKDYYTNMGSHKEKVNFSGVESKRMPDGTVVWGMASGSNMRQSNSLQRGAIDQLQLNGIGGDVMAGVERGFIRNFYNEEVHRDANGQLTDKYIEDLNKYKNLVVDGVSKAHAIEVTEQGKSAWSKFYADESGKIDQYETNMYDNLYSGFMPKTNVTLTMASDLKEQKKVYDFGSEYAGSKYDTQGNLVGEGTRDQINALNKRIEGYEKQEYWGHSPVEKPDGTPIVAGDYADGVGDFVTLDQLKAQRDDLLAKSTNEEKSLSPEYGLGANLQDPQRFFRVQQPMHYIPATHLMNDPHFQSVNQQVVSRYASLKGKPVKMSRFADGMVHWGATSMQEYPFYNVDVEVLEGMGMGWKPSMGEDGNYVQLAPGVYKPPTSKEIDADNVIQNSNKTTFEKATQGRRAPMWSVSGTISRKQFLDDMKDQQIFTTDINDIPASTEEIDVVLQDMDLITDYLQAQKDGKKMDDMEAEAYRLFVLNTFTPEHARARGALKVRIATRIAQVQNLALMKEKDAEAVLDYVKLQPAINPRTGDFQKSLYNSGFISNVIDPNIISKYQSKGDETPDVLRIIAKTNTSQVQFLTTQKQIDQRTKLQHSEEMNQQNTQKKRQSIGGQNAIEAFGLFNQ